MFALENLKAFFITKDQEAISLLKTISNYRKFSQDEKISWIADGYFQLKELKEFPQTLGKIKKNFSQQDKFKKFCKLTCNLTGAALKVLEPVSLCLAISGAAPRAENILSKFIRSASIAGLISALAKVIPKNSSSSESVYKKQKIYKISNLSLQIARGIFEKQFTNRHLMLLSDVALISTRYMVSVCNK